METAAGNVRKYRLDEMRGIMRTENQPRNLGTREEPNWQRWTNEGWKPVTDETALNDEEIEQYYQSKMTAEQRAQQAAQQKAEAEKANQPFQHTARQGRKARAAMTDPQREEYQQGRAANRQQAKNEAWHSVGEGFRGIAGQGMFGTGANAPSDELIKTINRRF
jgi:hypothetical protein